MKSKSYYFEEVLQCEMCGDATSSHTILGQRLNTSQGMRPTRKDGIAVSVKQCSRCHLIYSSPQPVPFDIQDHYGTPPESYWKDDYFIYKPEYFLYEANFIKKLLPFRPGMKALDIGAGLGKCMITLDKAGFDTYGFEPSEPFYKRAISQMGMSPDKLKLGMMEKMDYPDQTFDLILFGAVFEHLYHPAKSLETALQWLKPGGIVFIEVPSSKHFISRLVNLYYKVIGTNYVTHLSPMHAPFHLYEFDYKSFEILGRKAGFSIAAHRYEVCNIDFVPRIFHPILRWYMKLTDKGMQLIIYLRKN